MATLPPPVPNEEIWNSVQVFTITAIVTNVAFYLCLYNFWNAPFLRELTDKKKMSIIATMPSYVHAVISCALATCALCTQTSLYDDYIWGRSVVSSTACAFTAGYMAGDLLIMISHWRLSGNWQFVIHHLTSSLAFIYVCLYGGYSFFAMIRLLAEYSTICVNNRALFHDLGMQHGSVYFYNGIFMVISFTLARIVPFPWYLYCIYSVTGTEAYNNSGIGRYIIWSSTIFLDSLNFIWYHRMIKGAIKVWNSHKTVSSNGNRLKSTKQG